jgi:hypothetical protein
MIMEQPLRAQRSAPPSCGRLVIRARTPPRSPMAIACASCLQPAARLPWRDRGSGEPASSEGVLALHSRLARDFEGAVPGVQWANRQQF